MALNSRMAACRCLKFEQSRKARAFLVLSLAPFLGVFLAGRVAAQLPDSSLQENSRPSQFPLPENGNNPSNITIHHPSEPANFMPLLKDDESNQESASRVDELGFRVYVSPQGNPVPSRRPQNPRKSESSNNFESNSFQGEANFYIKKADGDSKDKNDGFPNTYVKEVFGDGHSNSDGGVLGVMGPIHPEYNWVLNSMGRNSVEDCVWGWGDDFEFKCERNDKKCGALVALKLPIDRDARKIAKRVHDRHGEVGFVDSNSEKDNVEKSTWYWRLWEECDFTLNMGLILASMAFGALVYALASLTCTTTTTTHHTIQADRQTYYNPIPTPQDHQSDIAHPGQDNSQYISRWRSVLMAAMSSYESLDVPDFSNGLLDSEIERLPIEEFCGKEAEGKLRCIICLTDVKAGERMRVIECCGHKFHPVCVDPWLKRSATCPLCRRSVKTSTTDSTSSDDNPMPGNFQIMQATQQSGLHSEPVTPPPTPLAEASLQLPPNRTPNAANDFNNALNESLGEAVRLGGGQQSDMDSSSDSGWEILSEGNQ